MSKIFKPIGRAISTVARAVTNVVSSVVKAAVNVVSSVVNFIAQPFMGLLGGIPNIEAPTAAQEAERQQGVLIQQQGSNINIPIVYGYRKVGGVVTFAETGSTNNRYLYVAYVFSEGVVEGLREVYIDDWQLPVNLTGSLNGGQVVDVNADRYSGRVRLQWWPGQFFSNPAQSPVGNSVKNGIFAEAPSFRNTMIYNGLAVMFARYEWKDIKTQEDADSNPFGGNIPQLQVGLLGKRVASLMVDTENTAYDSAPIRYSTNPAEILLDYLRNNRFGKGLKNSDIDWESWKIAARKCNQTVTYLATQNITGPIMTSNVVLDTSTTIMNNVKTLLMGFRGYMPYVQGKYKLKIEDAGNPFDITSGSAVINQIITKDDIIGNVTYTGIEKSNKYNVVVVNYVDPDQKFSVQEVIFPETLEERQRFIDIDGGRENQLKATFPTITNYAIAKDFARLLFNKSRRQETCSLTVTSKAIELEPGDNIRIQSNILNFGSDPWRIVSIKINDDMSVELGCVRNPDDIYPYTRVGEEDIVLPTYVPKGSVIYFPGSDNYPLLGLVPPTHAIYPPVFVPSPPNPGPTNPYSPPGGGVGGAGPIIPPLDPTQPLPPPIDDSSVPPINNPPVAPPPPLPFGAVLDYLRTDAPRLANGNFNFTVVFRQPADGLYDYSIFWWRINRFSAWQEIRVDLKPGAGLEIAVVLGALPFGVYNWYVRAYATDGRASDRLVRGQSTIVEEGSANNFVPRGSAEVISASGFSLPVGEVPTTPKYDSDIDLFYLRPVLSSGLPLENRKLRLTIQQIQSTSSTPINPLINGVTVYYRLRNEIYWSYETFTFPPSYVAGQIFDAELQGDFGARVYPNSIISNSINASLQTYEFLARLTYADGTPAEKQLGPGLGPVEQWTGLFNFVTFGRRLLNQSGETIQFTGVQAQNTAITAAFNTNFKTIDQAPPSEAKPGNELLPSLSRISSYRTNNNRLDWVFNQPVASTFRGFKIRWRPVEPGGSPPYQEVTSSGQGDNNNLIIYALLNNNFVYNKVYDFVVTAQFLDRTVNRVVDAERSLVSRTNVLNSDPQSDNLVAKFNFQVKPTLEALRELVDVFPAVPTVNPRKWNKIVPVGWNSYGVGDLEITGNLVYLNHWYNLEFQMPSTATAIVVYRRLYNLDGIARTTVTSTSKYYQLGPWDRVRIPRASIPTVGGWSSLNVKGPIEATEWFDTFFEVPGYSGRTVTWAPGTRGPIFLPTFPNTTSPYRLTGIRPYYGAGNDAVNSRQYVQYLFVIEDALGETNKGLLLRSFFTENSASSALYKSVREGFGEGNVQAIVVEDINQEFNLSVQEGYGRRLSEAVASPSIPNLRVRTNPGAPRASNWAEYDIFVRPPRDGTTVY